MTKELPVYISHKKVRALEIRSIGHYSQKPDPGAELMREIVFADPAYGSMDVPAALFSRYTPMPGDYYVVYDDGYASFSPRKAFLEGYSLARDGNVLMERLNDLATAAGDTTHGSTPEWLLAHDWIAGIRRVAREAYVTINSLKHQLETIQREKADPDQSE
jgi:hypothetical protein